MSKKNNERLEQEIASLYEDKLALKSSSKVAYWLMGIGIVLLAVGIANYGDSAWGLLWMPGVLGVGSGATGYSTDRAKSRKLDEKIASVRAVLEDRRGY
jgi:hypothetical protein